MLSMKRCFCLTRPSLETSNQCGIHFYDDGVQCRRLSSYNRDRSRWYAGTNEPARHHARPLCARGPHSRRYRGSRHESHSNSPALLRATSWAKGHDALWPAQRGVFHRDHLRPRSEMPDQRSDTSNGPHGKCVLLPGSRRGDPHWQSQAMDCYG